MWAAAEWSPAGAGLILQLAKNILGPVSIFPHFFPLFAYGHFHCKLLLLGSLVTFLRLCLDDTI